uniref:Uncharacterized protein n=1 Tax=Cacopsylla melanoneura TaxID=428564 RepID=A0A8D8RM25_9HEMI
MIHKLPHGDILTFTEIGKENLTQTDPNDASCGAINAICQLRVGIIVHYYCQYYALLMQIIGQETCRLGSKVETGNGSTKLNCYVQFKCKPPSFAGAVEMFLCVKNLMILSNLWSNN